ncbi:hypothetical protein NC99_09920 [Sunxiuqinia dokdonensis]|uniref:Uncharacterized protein n=1 Tax=Sunxiuqinia dokdonensis TaxID=1409788 RepID=A0A0L8VCN4_9BACT|nr:hypothetical protein NC99_09920 [Sunxiuqinia dokdonensis]
MQYTKLPEFTTVLKWVGFRAYRKKGSSPVYEEAGCKLIG